MLTAAKNSVYLHARQSLPVPVCEALTLTRGGKNYLRPYAKSIDLPIMAGSQIRENQCPSCDKPGGRPQAHRNIRVKRPWCGCLLSKLLDADSEGASVVAMMTFLSGRREAACMRPEKKPLPFEGGSERGTSDGRISRCCRYCITTKVLFLSINQQEEDAGRSFQSRLPVPAKCAYSEPPVLLGAEAPAL